MAMDSIMCAFSNMFLRDFIQDQMLFKQNILPCIHCMDIYISSVTHLASQILNNQYNIVIKLLLKGGHLFG